MAWSGSRRGLGRLLSLVTVVLGLGFAGDVVRLRWRAFYFFFLDDFDLHAEFKVHHAVFVGILGVGILLSEFVIGGFVCSFTTAGLDLFEPGFLVG